MKSYTDIEQSKLLAEILPLESADMEFMFLKKDNSMVSEVPFIKDGYEEPDCPYNMVSCWSLAALLGVLPLEIDTHKQTDGYKIYYYVELYMKRNGKEIYLSTERHENLIDACYEMILKLHELNLL